MGVQTEYARTMRAIEAHAAALKDVKKNLSQHIPMVRWPAVILGLTLGRG